MKLQSMDNLNLIKAVKLNQFLRVKWIVENDKPTALNCAYHFATNDLIKKFLLNKLIIDLGN